MQYVRNGCMMNAVGTEWMHDECSRYRMGQAWVTEYVNICACII